VDLNQRAIVDALRAAGRSVEVLSAVGKGCPDLLVALRGRMWLLEVKMPGGELSDVQVAWHQRWRTHVQVVRTVQEAIEATT
jgi:hypothetical protein